MDGEAAHVFLDSNTGLHFRRAGEVERRTLTGARQGVLVVAPVLLRELDREKVQNPIFETLADLQSRALERIGTRCYPERDTVLLLLSFKAWLRAKEISALSWYVWP